ncbi:restriction endonuclease subunit S [Pseudovibrio sp. Ad37]|uniref:restriction endonuclease subunit S n=1 Tax=Pseudovibrio sp. Ad37 TaxID=989422 RepID=UPI0007AEA4D8|nr:restriction endonuclease subunit S [Pseudovibrio sp. Ad37]KZL28522.1 Type-1 restriction enzyme EcoKI specificity protein [Pseudovibrio sp. Ad37]
MSGLPEGWIGTTLGEIVSESKVKLNPQNSDTMPFLGMDDVEAQTGRVINVADTGQLKSSVITFNRGDLLFGRLRPYLRKIFIANFDGTASAEFIVMRENGASELTFTRNQLFSSEFLEYCNRVSTGDRPRVSFKSISGFPLNLPPLPEQKRIVAKIESLTAKSRIARESLARIDTLTKRYKQAILKKAFSGELTADWRKNAKWPDSAQLLDFADSFSYGSSSKSAKEGSVPVLRMGNIQDGKLVWDSLVYATSDNEVAKYRLHKGDVLFNRTNSPELVGKTALFKGEREAIYAGYLIKVRCSEKLLPEYLTYALNSPEGRAYSWRVKSDGVSQSNINAKKLREFSFSIPSIPEQKEIVTRIEVAFGNIDRLAVEAERALHLVDRLDEKILAKAFRGELVQQDPNDEPASVLLERIKAERAAQPKVVRKKVSRKKTEISKMAKTVLDALKEADEWLESQRLFQLCGVKDGTSTGEIELIYQQLLDLERQNKIEIKAVRNKDDIKQTDMVRFVA